METGIISIQMEQWLQVAKLSMVKFITLLHLVSGFNVGGYIDENFEKTNKTFLNVVERLSKIDEAQKKIETLSTDIVSLESILTDKKTRGIFGEVTLNHILKNVFGEKNDSIYQIQYKSIRRPEQDKSM